MRTPELPPKQAEWLAARQAERTGRPAVAGQHFRLSPETVAWLAELHASPNGRGWARLCDLLTDACNDAEVAASRGASEFLAVMCEIAADSLSFQSGDQALEFALDGVMPKGMLGAKFQQGRKLNAVGPVRRAVQRIVKTNPTATASDVWILLGAQTKSGLKCFNNKFGRYIESTGEDGTIKSTSYARFANVVSEVRNAAK